MAIRSANLTFGGGKQFLGVIKASEGAKNGY